jgi:hypothetical protein
MGRLRAAFISIDDDLQDACFQRGLLPRHITESLRMARFLSITLPSARAAQDETGVPASILLAEAFSARAHWLIQQPSFNQVMRATGDATFGFTHAAYPSNFMDLIAAWSKAKYGEDLVATISAHSLLECDRMVPVR